MRKKKSGKNILYMFLITAVVTIAVFIMCVFLWERASLKMAPDEPAKADSSTYTQAQVDQMVDEAKEEGRREILDSVRTYLGDGSSVINILKILYPDYVVAASGGTFHFHEIDSSLPMNDYSADNLQINEDNGIYTYHKDGQVVSAKGVDVSSHQGKIDWEKVAADDVEFAFVRALFRGYESGALVEDDYFMDNVKGAQKNGIKVGAYVFSQAINEAEAVEEANKVLEMLDGRALDLPIVYDVEKVTSSKARMNKLTVEERTKVTKVFLQIIEDSGYDAMVYYNTEMGSALLDVKEVIDYPTWFANYSSEFYWPYRYMIWQYTANGKVDGIKGDVDLDIMLDASQLASMSKTE